MKAFEYVLERSLFFLKFSLFSASLLKRVVYNVAILVTSRLTGRSEEIAPRDRTTNENDTRGKTPK